ncbi:MAG: protein kinase [bacterium]|nr:protein kinase [bacterium]
MAVSLRRLEGKYEILRKLREGGMGAVYHVRHRLLGDERVVKIMRPQLAEDSTLRQRFEREARAASRLNHPNIAQLYDFTIDEEGFAYIVMEYIRGLTLEELIDRDERVPLGLAIEIVQQSLYALGHLHANGMVHRDISPDNLMLTRDVDGAPQVKLIDLGIAKSLEGETGLTAAGMFVGKVRYASPEQFENYGAGEPGGGEIRPQSDLYSLGLVLYELLTRQYPILGDNATSIIAGHLFRPPLDFGVTDPEGRLPGELRRAVLRALAKDPAERFDNAASFSTALASCRRPGDLTTPRVRQFIAVTSGDQPSAVSAETPSAPLTEVDEAVLDTSIAQVEELIGDGRLGEARTTLHRTEESFGRDPRVLEIGGRLDEIEQITNRSRARRLLRQARETADRSEFGIALELLREAMQLTTGDEQLQSLLRDTEKAVRQREAESRRQQLIAERATVIGRLLDDGELDPADVALREAGESFGKHARLSELRQRLERLVEGARRREIARFVEGAQSLVEEGHWEPARDEVGKALVLDPDDGAARELHSRIEGELERREQEQRRLRAITTAVQEIEALIVARDAEGAAVKLEESRCELGPDEALTAIEPRIEALREELEAARRRDEAEERRQQEIEALRREAAGLRAAGQRVAALERLRAALSMAPGEPELERLASEIEKEIVLERRQEQRQRERLALEREIEELVRQGRFEQARERLVAGGELGRSETLEDLDRRIAEGLEEIRRRRLESDRRAQADELVARARSLSQTEEFTRAQQTLSQAVELAPDHREALTLSRSIAHLRTLQEKEASSERAIEAEIAEIRRVLGEGQPGEAMKLLNDAFTQFGDRQELQALRYETAQAFLEDEDEGESYPTDSAATLASEGETLRIAEAAPAPPEETPTSMLTGSTAPIDYGLPASEDVTIRTPGPAPAEEARVSPLLDDQVPPGRYPRSADLMLGEEPVGGGVDELPLAGMGMVPAEEPEPRHQEVHPVELGFGRNRPDDEPELFLDPRPRKPTRRSFDLSNPAVWVLFVAVLVIVFFLGKFIAERGSDSGPSPEPEIEDVQDVQAPEY